MKKVLIIIGILLVTLTTQAQQIAVKTNGLMWAATMPNLSMEFVTGEHSSLDLTAAVSQKVWSNPFKMVAVQPEYRYWFNGRPMVREYIGVAALGATYDITWGDKMYDGDAVGAGVTIGYALTLGKRLNVEFYGGFGAVYFRQKQYYIDDNYTDFDESEVMHVNSSGYKLIPIKLGVSISWIVK
ncbi:MAG: DUF3575 domain-containing protein [Mediterranea massiliensis]|nr:DUF3575 domain-containing protein [Mediterranea massiliensis]